MKRFAILSILMATILLTSFSSGLNAGQAEQTGNSPAKSESRKSNEGFVSLFSGKTFKGWYAADMSWWSITDGAITGTITKEKPCSKNQYIFYEPHKLGDADLPLYDTKGQMFNYELKLTHRILSPHGVNGGFQYRSEHYKDGDCRGYQIDNNTKTPWLARMYDEFGRHTLAWRGERTRFDEAGKRHVTKIETVPAKAHFSLEQWHEYHLTCRGTQMTLYIDGQLVAEVFDEQPSAADLSGLFAPQLHSGPPMVVQFKNILYKPLPASKAVPATPPMPAKSVKVAPAPKPTPTTKPNFVVIFVDDMGYGDIEPFGSKQHRTPNLARMAAEGMKLTSFYVASPVCTPSRAALMTGCYPQRVGLARGSGHAVLFPGDVHGLHPSEITIAETLKAAGYATGCFGKWHLGDQPEFLPTEQGFDVYFGIPYSNDMWPGLKRWHFPDLPILQGTKVVDLVRDMDAQATLCRRFTEQATAFIRKHKDGPFFTYLPHAFVHAPRRASPRFMADGKSVEQAQVEEVDWSVGEVLKALREAGVAENTLVLFTSDNGPAGGLSSGPLRGRKGSGYEGGHREPTLAWWPGVIPAGSVCDEIATTMDLLPTCAKLSGADVPGDRVIDGKDIAALLLGTPGANSPHDRFFYQQGGMLRAVRSGAWKLFVSGELYNLDVDLAEKANVAADNPDVVAALRKLLSEFKTDLAKNSREVGVAKNPRTLVPRPGVDGEEAYRPTLSLPRRGE